MASFDISKGSPRHRLLEGQQPRSVLSCALTCVYECAWMKQSPFAWAISMYNHPYHTTMALADHQNRSLAHFCGSPYETSYTIDSPTSLDVHPYYHSSAAAAAECNQEAESVDVHEYHATLGALRTSKLRSHLSVPNMCDGRMSRFHVLRYEDVLLDPEGKIRALLVGLCSF